MCEPHFSGSIIIINNEAKLNSSGNFEKSETDGDNALHGLSCEIREVGDSNRKASHQIEKEKSRRVDHRMRYVPTTVNKENHVFYH